MDIANTSANGISSSWDNSFSSFANSVSYGLDGVLDSFERIAEETHIFDVKWKKLMINKEVL